MTVVKNRNFARKQVDLAEFNDKIVVFEHCNLSQLKPGTNPFLNLDLVDVVEFRECNTVNVADNPKFKFVNCNRAQIDFSAIMRLDFHLVEFHDKISQDLRKIWRGIRDFIIANPNATWQDFRSWFVKNMGDTIFYSQQFFFWLKEYLKKHAAVTDWDSFKQWVLSNHNAQDFEEIV